MPAQRVGESLERRRRIDPFRRVVRRVDQDDARPGRERARDGVHVQIERRGLDPDPDRRAGGSQDHRLVEEPGRRDEHDLVAGVDDHAERQSERAMGSAREQDVVRLERQAQLLAERGGGRPAGPRVRETVREPPPVRRHGPLLKGLDIPGQRRLLGIPGQEVTGLGVVRERAELLHHAEERLQGRESPLQPRRAHVSHDTDGGGARRECPSDDSRSGLPDALGQRRVRRRAIRTLAVRRPGKGPTGRAPSATLGTTGNRA
jgi:hypothetical protein